MAGTDPPASSANFAPTRGATLAGWQVGTQKGAAKKHLLDSSIRVPLGSETRWAHCGRLWDPERNKHAKFSLG